MMCILNIMLFHQPTWLPYLLCRRVLGLVCLKLNGLPMVHGGISSDSQGCCTGYRNGSESPEISCSTSFRISMAGDWETESKQTTGIPSTLGREILTKNRSALPPLWLVSEGNTLFTVGTAFRAPSSVFFRAFNLNWRRINLFYRF